MPDGQKKRSRTSDSDDPSDHSDTFTGSNAFAKTAQSNANSFEYTVERNNHVFKKRRVALRDLMSGPIGGISNVGASSSYSSSREYGFHTIDGSTSGNREKEDLIRRQGRWKSPIYSFFDAPTLHNDNDNRPFQHFKCKASRCKASGGVRRYTDKSDKAATSNLAHHARKCFGKEAVDAAVNGHKESTLGSQNNNQSALANIDESTVSLTYKADTSRECRATVVRWITENCLPSTIVEDRNLRVLILAGRPQAKLPSCQDADRDIDTSFNAVRERILYMLKEYPGQLSFSSGSWASANHRHFVAWIAHLQREGKPLSFLLDLVEVPESYTGEMLACEFEKILGSLGLSQKVLSLTSDNADSDTAQAASLDQSTNNPFQNQSHVRCFKRTISLAAKAFLDSFMDTESEKDYNKDRSNSDEDEVISGSAFCSIGVGDIDLDSQTTELFDVLGREDDEVCIADGIARLPYEEKKTFERECTEVKAAVKKMRGLTFSIIRSHNTGHPAWHHACVRRELKPRLLLYDVKQPWNSRLEFLDFILEYRAAVKDITRNEKSYQKYELTLKEWEILNDLHYVLEILKKAIIYFSSDDASSISGVIPAMDKIEDLITTQSAPSDVRILHSSAKTGLRLIRNIMSRCHSSANESSVYSIAMALHPTMKLDYFRQRKRETPRIEEAQSLTRLVYDNYRSRAIPLHKAENNTPLRPVASDLDVFDFSAISVIPCFSLARDELTEYLSQPLEATKDPLGWWWSKRTVFPVLSQMALDYHSIPTTSTSVKYVFSQQRRLLLLTHPQLSGSSIRKMLCLGSWSRKNLFQDQVVIDAIAADDEKRECSERKSTT